MTKKTVADASAELYKLLEPFEAEERVRIVRGTLTLLGADQSILADGGDTGDQGSEKKRGPQGKGARAFFDAKRPENKIEELATAARYHEQSEDGAAITKDNFKRILAAEARRNFDAHNFKRDINNARSAGFFNKGGSAKLGYTLSYYGQNYVDALPDREAARKLPRPKRSAARRAKKRAAKA